MGFACLPQLQRPVGSRGTIPALRTVIMNTRPLAFAAALILASCAGAYIKHTEVATGATNPRAIYIRPFDVSQARFGGHHGDGPGRTGDGGGEKPLRKSLAPAEFSEALKEELEKIAPTIVLKDDEVPPVGEGWLVEGYFEVVHAGSPILRSPPIPHALGRSTVRIHVQILETAHLKSSDPKSATGGRTLYEFDVAGGSGFSGPYGSMHAPGLGYATPFDYRNAAERIYVALSPDPFKYGVRSSPIIR